MRGRASRGKKLGPRGWIVAAREHFKAIGVLLDSSPSYLVTKHSRSILILLGFGYEDLLKGLTVETSGNPIRGHDLIMLFGELDLLQRDLLIDSETAVSAAVEQKQRILTSDDLSLAPMSQPIPQWPARISQPRHTFATGLQNLTNWTADQNHFLARYPETETYLPGQDFDIDCCFMCNVGWFACERWIANDRAALRDS